MRSQNMLLVLLVCGAVALFASSPASAYIINYGADGALGGGDDTPLFYDNFESQPSNMVSHAAAPDYSVYGRPAGTVLYGGYWTNLAGPGVNDEVIQVTDYADIAYEGENCFRYYARTINSSHMDFQSGQTSGVVHWEQMVYIAPDAHSYYARLFNTSGGTVLGLATMEEFDYQVGNRDSSGVFRNFYDMGIEMDTWQLWEVDYEIGSNAVTLTVDDVSHTWSRVSSPGNVARASVCQAGDSSTYFCIDEIIPEPGTLALLVSGLIGLLAYAWRKRK